MPLLFPKLAGAALALTVAGSACAAYPDKPITFIVPFAAGSATDQIGRALGQGVTEASGQTVIVENRPGASAMIGAQAAARAQPDGYTVLITTNTTQSANPHLYKQLAYDPVRDFAPVSLLGKGGQIMVVPPSSKAQTVQDFVAEAKAAPGTLSFGSGSSSSRMAGELLKQMADIDLLHVPYKSNPLAITDLLGGQISMMITDTATGLPQVKSGKLRALGVTGTQRSPLAPDVPTIAESGVPGYEMGYWFAAYVPAGTDPSVVQTLNSLLRQAMTSNAAKQFYAQTGTAPEASTPDELAAFQADETVKWGTIIQKAGIKPE